MCVKQIQLAKLNSQQYAYLISGIFENLTVSSEELTVLHGFDNFGNCGFGFAF